MKHTPKQWDVNYQKQNGVIKYWIPQQGDNDYETEANSHLIAAAPELLEALQAFVDYHATDYEDIPEMEQARLVIARAKGEMVRNAND